MKIKNPFGSFFDMKFFNSMINGIIILVFIFVAVILIKVIVNVIFPVPVTPTDFDPLFIEYMGLPYVFWVLLGVGIALGLTLHGFKLVHIEIKK